MFRKEGPARGDNLAEAVNLHNQGIDGDQEAVKKAHQMFKKICADNPADQLAAAYLGSATTLLGRDETDLDKRFKLAMEGLKLLDHAVSQESENTEIRILRGMVCYNLPDMYFHRLTTAVEDFCFLVSRYKKRKKIFSRELYWKILFNLGSAYKSLGRKEESEATWRKLLSVNTDPEYKELLRQEGFNVPYSYFSYKEKTETRSSVDKPLEEAREMHRRASAGDKDAAQQAMAYFEKAHKQNPRNHLTLAYYADCLSIVGRESADHALLFGNAIRAMIDLDKAANSSPENVDIRLLRANHSYRLPEAFFRRSATAMGDYEYLIQRYEQDDSIFSKETCLRIMENLGEVYQRLEMEEEAKDIWNKLLSMTDDPKYRDLLQKTNEETGFDPVKARSMTWKQALQEGIRLHDLGVAGNKKAARIALQLLRGVYKAHPRNPVVEGYYGSSLALAGRDSRDPSVMFANGIKGLKLVKTAVARDPNNPKLRILRGYLAYSLPENFFHLSQTAIEDFRFLLKSYESNQGIFSKELYWQIHYDLGAAYRRIGDNTKARKVWAILLKESPDPKYRNLVESMGG